MSKYISFFRFCKVFSVLVICLVKSVGQFDSDPNPIRKSLIGFNMVRESDSRRKRWCFSHVLTFAPTYYRFVIFGPYESLTLRFFQTYVISIQKFCGAFPWNAFFSNLDEHKGSKIFSFATHTRWTSQTSDEKSTKIEK